MDDIDHHLEQIRALLDHGYVARAHALVTSIAATAPHHEPAQALLAEATDRLTGVAAAYVPHDPVMRPVSQRQREGVPILLILALVIVVGGVILRAWTTSQAYIPLSPSPTPTRLLVTYHVTSADNSLVDLTYGLPGVGINLVRTGPWTFTQEVYQGSDVRVEVRAFRATTVTCMISSESTIIAQASFSGTDGSAICRGSAH